MSCKADPNGHHNTMVKIARSEFAILTKLEKVMQQVLKIKKEVMELRQAARKISDLTAEPSQPTPGPERESSC